MYYGQFDTDRLIDEFFNTNYPGLVGYAVEVGAAQGIAASNTLVFDQRGWKCLCIEPNPGLFSQLQRNRHVVLNCAISDHNADLENFSVVSFCNGDETAISSLRLDEQLLEQHISLVSKVRNIKVNVRTLDRAIEHVMFPSVDLVSIDTEGTELDVLRGFSIHKYAPKLFVIENNFNIKDIEDYLDTFGYRKIFRHVVNDFYTYKDKK
jgi:FkbM family methyltransferase